MPPRAYTCGHTGALNQITGTFPGATSVTYLDGYFVFTAAEPTSKWFISGLLDPNAYDALDFAYTDGEPDLVRRVLTLHGELWFVGDTSVEVWYDAGSSGLESAPGTSFFPFRRRAGGVIEHGAESPKTVCICDGSLFWLSDAGIVLRSNGYRAVRISTHALEQKIRLLGIPAIAASLSYIQDGHTFYVLTFSSATSSATLVYDCTTQKWHERSSSADGTAPWRPWSAYVTTGLSVFGDSLSGDLMFAQPYVDTDYGVPVRREVVLPPLWGQTRFAFCARVEVECDMGQAQDPITLEWSDDGGFTFPRSRALANRAAVGARARVYTTRLGSFRHRVFRLVLTHGVTLYAVDADIHGGTV
ncbi:MAG TPA: hypothetical protein VGK33_19425 [Chloroflexota bacterium]